HVRIINCRELKSLSILTSCKVVAAIPFSEQITFTQIHPLEALRKQEDGMGFFGKYFSGLLGRDSKPGKGSGDMRKATGAGP
ncbi:MAG: hypothetical protein E5Y31_33075, partial [Mesorhizobium sp.]